MYGPSSGLKDENKSHIIKLMKNQYNNNDSINGIEMNKSNKIKDINIKSYITKKNNPEEYNKKINQYIIYHQNYKNNIESKNNIKPKTPKKPLLIPKQGSIQINNDEEKYLRNNFIKFGKNNNLKNYVSPSFDYNIKNNHKNKDIKLSLKNSNSIPIKLQNSELKNAFKNRKINKQHFFSNSSINVKASSSSINEMDSLINKMRKNNILNKKQSEMNNKYNFNNNYNPEIRKYISFTPGPVKKTSFIKNKVSTSNDFEDKRRKEEIKMIFEREFKRKMNAKKSKNNKKSNNSSLMTKNSRNNKTEENKNLRNSQSQNNINNKMRINKKEFEAINSYKRSTNTNIENNSNFTYEKYHSLLEQKIVKLNNEIANLKREEKDLQNQLINYKEKEKECNDIRKIREEIEKYKIIFDKSSKACEEYHLEIQKIKNIIGENDINKDENELIGNNYIDSED